MFRDAICVPIVVTLESVVFTIRTLSIRDLHSPEFRGKKNFLLLSNQYRQPIAEWLDESTNRSVISFD
jgi:hypothetical protein